MPLKQKNLGLPMEWLKRAKSNLARAKQPKSEEIYWEDLCFDLQQACEKALKALILAKGIEFRFIHDLAELLTCLKNNNINIPESIKQAATLTIYAVESRYPGQFEKISETEYREALKIAEELLKWSEEQIKSL